MVDILVSEIQVDILNQSYTLLKLKYIFTGLILINSVLISQSKTDDYYRVILLSLNAGYHTGFDLIYDDGFPEGPVFGGSVALGVSKNIILGVNFDYWKRENVVTHPSLASIVLTKNYSGFGYRFFVQYRNTFLDHLNLFVDAGLGRYKISYDYVYNNTYISNYNYYLIGGVSVGAGYKFSRLLSVNAELSHYGLSDIDFGGSRSVYTTNIKVGPVFYLQLK